MPTDKQSGTGKKDTIAFLVFENRDLVTYPSVINSAKLLADDGYQVQILIPDAMNTSFANENIEIITVSRYDFSAYVKNTKKYLVETPGISFAFVFYFEGLAAISQANSNLSTPIPYIYISQELIYKRQLSANTRLVLKIRSWLVLAYLKMKIGWLSLFKRTAYEEDVKKWYQYAKKDMQHALYWLYSWYQFQLKGSKKALAMIAQDAKRVEILCREMDWKKQTLVLPNSYIGFRKDSSDWAYQKFGIPAEKKIILYIGSVEKGFDLGLFEMAAAIEPDQVLFMHCLSRDHYVEELITKYTSLVESGRLYINNAILDEKDLDELVRSSYICIAWYYVIPQWDENMYYVGWSSGKLCKYLASGKPVIVPLYISNYELLVENNGIGLACNSTVEIPAAIGKIRETYTAHVSALEAFYNSELEFKTKFKAVKDLMIPYTNRAELYNNPLV